MKLPESVLVLIHSPQREVLLLERTDAPGGWQSVTGSRASADEPLRDTAVREVAEETGIAVGSPDVPAERLVDLDRRHVYEILPAWAHRYAPGVTHNTEHVFTLQVDRGTPIRLSPHEHMRFEWLPWRDAATRCFSRTNAAAILDLGNTPR
ncbi:dihydroneopterin triphosphate diphosphatase [Rhizobacter sp. OV335]|uniref:dihydroneopterin triphosphate diphosphatase n=1 Tax=Rhizobacter sp. OV335 TaxID=1500264 RepID=UPI000920E8D7|nr:dihydroneopterin triphosphate diphosphatase [Rhizobacter sp. OV335]SHM39578.1 dATP pyrophosphohydrolase [Rhizobacter sp. OV335]